jgi:hypothetical protein
MSTQEISQDVSNGFKTMSESNMIGFSKRIRDVKKLSNNLEFMIGRELPFCDDILGEYFLPSPTLYALVPKCVLNIVPLGVARHKFLCLFQSQLEGHVFPCLMTHAWAIKERTFFVFKLKLLGLGKAQIANDILMYIYFDCAY